MVDGRAGSRRAVLHIAAQVAALLVAFAVLPQRVVGDDATRVAALRQLADGVMPETKYSLVQPLLSVPLYWLLDGLGLGVRAVTLQPMLWLAAWCAVMWSLVRRYRSDDEARDVVVLSVVSLVAAYVIGFSSDLFSALAISAGLTLGLLARSTPSSVLGWVLVVVGAANTPALVVAVAAACASLVAARRQVRFVMVPIAVALVVAAEASWASGTPTWTKFDAATERGNVALLPWGEIAGFGWPLWSGLLAVLFSFGRGLAFYLPTWVGGPTPRHDDLARAERALWLGAAAIVPLYATWWAWYGGVTFGPRFFLVAVVPLALGTASALRRPRGALRSAVLTSAVVMSAWVAVSGATIGVTPDAFERCVDGGRFTDEALCWYTPEYSSLWAPAWSDVTFGPRQLCFVAVVIVALLPTFLRAAVPLWAAASRWLARLRPASGWRW